MSINGDMVRQEIEESISSLTAAGFKVRAVVADNHASNVSEITQLWNSYGTESDNNFHINFNFKQELFDVRFCTFSQKCSQ